VDGYHNRPFSMGERVLTQPRVLLFYVSQLFYPMPQRLSIDHDVTVSTGLLAPWTTLPALLLVLGLIILAVWRMRRNPLVAWGLLFFFLNHAIEAGILPLELLFEHRNYLPSLFIFVPAAALLYKALQYYRARQVLIYRLLAVFVPLVLLGLGSATYVRNRAWLTEQSLWVDAMAKAPASARPYINLAWDLGWGYNEKLRRYDAAIDLYKKSLTKQRRRTDSIAGTLNNIAGLYIKTGAYDEALEFCRQALELQPDSNTAQYNAMIAWARTGRLQEAAVAARELVQKNYNTLESLNILGLVQLKQGQTTAALVSFERALKIDPRNSRSLLFMGQTLSRMQRYDPAERYLRRALAQAPDDLMIHLHLVENSLRAETPDRAAQYLEQLAVKFPVQRLAEGMTRLCTDPLSPPGDYQNLGQAIFEELNRRAARIGAFDPAPVRHNG
jgi:tetratricopeptide (TPR) repeat protein